MKIMFLRNTNAPNPEWLVQFVGLLHTKECKCAGTYNIYKRVGDKNKLLNRFVELITFKIIPLLSKKYYKTKDNLFSQKEIVCIHNLLEQMQKNDRANLEIEKKRIIYVQKGRKRRETLSFVGKIVYYFSKRFSRLDYY